MKKTTLKDVANEAGVSIATASYVLNKVSGQTIPEETRQRVVEAAAKLNYVRNLAARSLSSGRTNLLGVLLVGDDADPVSKYVGYGKFIDGLERICRTNRYHLMVACIDPKQPDFSIIAERKLDGVFLIDACESSFYRVSEKFPYGSPVLLIDGTIEDSLFRKLTSDYGQLFGAVRERLNGADEFAVLHERYHNQAVGQAIREASGSPPDRITAIDGSGGKIELRAFAERHRKRPVVVFGEFLALRLLAVDPSLHLLAVCTSGCPEYLPERVDRLVPKLSKAEAAADMMFGLLGTSGGDVADRTIAFEFEFA
ncbi:LacI family DNA-binding transcriptional regulator [Cohnella fermenti]|uniref:LacI family transcriptional regulator n=1 Tax=Cohnella fermenti TaxID=2565925 RepID=A0A4S4BQS3_9BACL|nr:LacI family DNA-binding transcriptional regulator [Cohnella fermenti]THF77293.1 LacI family transcriptional regulator [Cohnella fermenti]